MSSRVLFYDDDIAEVVIPRPSVFLAGPTARTPAVRTPWRADALELLAELCPAATVIVPEFRDRPFDREHFERCPHPYKRGGLPPDMKRSTYNILEWETSGINQATVLLVWMPFSEELPGRTTRSEVAFALGMKRSGLVLGMPPEAEASGFIRYHAHQAEIPVRPTLRSCCELAAKMLVRRGW